MRFRIVVVMIGVVLSFVLPGSPVVAAQESNVIRWVKPNAAPIFIRSGELKNKGFGDKVFHDFKVGLPQFQHQDTRINHARMKAEMNKGTNVCALLHKTPEREALMYFSDFVMVSPASQVYIRADSEEQFQTQTGIYEQGVDLAELLESERSLIMGILPGRSYGLHRDLIINRYQNYFKKINLSSGMPAPVKMLVGHRLDMIVEYPWLVRYQLSRLNTSTPLQKISLLKAPGYDKTYVTCPKTAWGQTVIDEVNKLIPSLRHQFSLYLEEWLTEDEITEYRQFIMP